MSELRKYIWIGIISARSNLAYFGEVSARVIFLGVLLYVFLQLWRVTYAEAGSEKLGDLTFAQMIWYLAMAEAIVLSRPLVAQEVAQDVRTGALSIQLIRPLSYPLYRLWKNLGERTVCFLLNATIAILIAFVFVGLIPFTSKGLIMFALSLPLAFALDFLGFFLIGLSAFWLEDTGGLVIIYSRITMILGGTLIPIELFPEALQPLLRILPFSSIVYGPSRLFVNSDPTFLGDLFVKQGIMILVFSLCTTALYRTAVKRLFSNGG